jgi:hypothetical protein
MSTLSAVEITIFLGVAFALGMTLGIVLSRHSTTQTKLGGDIAISESRVNSTISTLEAKLVGQIGGLDERMRRVEGLLDRNLSAPFTRQV